MALAVLVAGAAAYNFIAVPSHSRALAHGGHAGSAAPVSFEAVDEVDRDPIVGHLRNLLQKALKSSKVMKAQRAKRSADELFPRLQPLGFPEGCVPSQFCFAAGFSF